MESHIASIKAQIPTFLCMLVSVSVCMWVFMLTPLYIFCKDGYSASDWCTEDTFANQLLHITASGLSGVVKLCFPLPVPQQ